MDIMYVAMYKWLYLSIFSLSIYMPLCPGYHRTGFVVTQVLGYMMYSYTLLVPMNQKSG